MTDAEFKALVFEMRKHQKSYFKTRDVGDLRASKDYERRVDAALDEARPRPDNLFYRGKV